MVVISLGYLWLFVPRGWVPHDEGMLGQAAERALLGGIPHVDYQEPYTGGLTWLYSFIFRFIAVDLLYVRWLLFAGASVAQFLMYSVLRRYLGPIGSALASWVGLTWSFPNYFAGLPSWWVLICALCGLWAFVRYLETARLRYAVMAGLAAGCSIVVKQTGVYLLIALVMSLLYEGGHRDQAAPALSRSGRVARAVVAVAALLLALAVVRSRLAPAEMLYLILPIAACSLLLLTANASVPSSQDSRGLRAIGAAVAAAALPIAWFMTPYLVHHQLGNLIQGALVLPQKRLVFAGMAMPWTGFALAGLPLVALVIPFSRATQPSRVRTRVIAIGAWTLAAVLAVGSLYSSVSYQIVWQSTRTCAALLPVVICWRLISGDIDDPRQRRLLFAFSSMLAWASLVQFPFSAPIYFCYVAPLAVLAGAASAAACSRLKRVAIGAWVALLIVFAVLSMNREYIYDLGQRHSPQAMNVELDLPRAHLKVSEEDALTYRPLMRLIRRRLGEGHLFAGPDCPEVYFLAGRLSRSGALFEFFSDDVFGGQNATGAPEWADASVVVLNHGPLFSPGPSPPVTSAIRQRFPKGESIGRFEVRWR